MLVCELRKIMVAAPASAVSNRMHYKININIDGYTTKLVLLNFRAITHEKFY